jgi:ribosome-associated protein
VQGRTGQVAPIRINEAISIDEREIEERFIRASGPGGQNVNKLASAVQLRFDVRGSSLPEEVRERLARLAGRRLTRQGVLVMSALRHRTQERNRADARERLIVLISRAAVARSPRRAGGPARNGTLGSFRKNEGTKLRP